MFDLLFRGPCTLEVHQEPKKRWVPTHCNFATIWQHEETSAHFVEHKNGKHQPFFARTVLKCCPSFFLLGKVIAQRIRCENETSIRHTEPMPGVSKLNLRFIDLTRGMHPYILANKTTKNPAKLTWNLRIHPWKRKIIFQTIYFQVRFVNLLGVYGWLRAALEGSISIFKPFVLQKWSINNFQQISRHNKPSLVSKFKENKHSGAMLVFGGIQCSISLVSF